MSADTPEQGVARLGGLGYPPAFTRLEVLAHRPGHTLEQAPQAQHPQGIGEGRGVGGGGSRRDGREVVAHHIRQYERANAGGRSLAGEATALEAREVLAHGVELVDVRARLHQ
jgi:hypothetical protein